MTGAAGLIGANVVLDEFGQGAEPVLVADKLSYAGNRDSSSSQNVDYSFHFSHHIAMTRYLMNSIR